MEVRFTEHGGHLRLSKWEFQVLLCTYVRCLVFQSVQKDTGAGGKVTKAAEKAQKKK